jgi:excisionase family DNA binding protein
MLTLGEAARHCRVSKGTISKAIKTGKLSATRREDGSWSIDGAELARYVEVNGHRFKETGDPDRPETGPTGTSRPVCAVELVEVRARAELAEARLRDLQAALADMREQRDKWQDQAARLALPQPIGGNREIPPKRSWWWRRSA